MNNPISSFSAVQSLSCSSSQTATQLTVSCSNAGDLTNLRCSVDGDTSSVCELISQYIVVLLMHLFCVGMLPYTRDISGLQTGKHTVTISATTVSSGSARSATLSFNTQGLLSSLVYPFIMMCSLFVQHLSVQVAVLWPVQAISFQFPALLAVQ